MQADKAVSQTGHKVLVVVARAEHQVAVDSQDPQSVQQCHLLSYSLVGSTELVQHGPIQTVVDGVKGKTLGPPLRLREEKDGGYKKVQEDEKSEKYTFFDCVAATLLCSGYG